MSQRMDQRMGQIVLEKPKYIKLSPASIFYRKVMSLADERNCTWQDVVRDALAFYFEFHEKKIF